MRQLYWQYIKEGKLPRNSRAATILLYSIDIGLDTVNTPGLQDWDPLAKVVDIGNKTDAWYTYSLYAMVSGDHVETSIFILMSFIEAHEEAQRKIAYYFGETEDADTPEEALVVRESRQNVASARVKLNEISVDIIGFYHSKQAARVLLHAQEEMVEELVTQGILQEKDAGLLLKAVQADIERLEKRKHTVLALLGLAGRHLWRWLTRTTTADSTPTPAGALPELDIGEYEPTPSGVFTSEVEQVRRTTPPLPREDDFESGV